MSSKNNPLNRKRDMNVKKIDGKVVKPCKFIFEGGNYMAAAFEDGKLVMDPRTNLPVQYQNV
jgi:hypothetical protein